MATAPGPPGFFPALQLYNRPFGTMPVYLRELAERYGPVTRLRGPLVDVYLIDDPLALEEVYVTKGRSFMKGRGAQRLRPLLGNGLLTSEEPEHLRNRRLVQPAFNKKRVEAYAPSIVAAAARRAERWRDGATVAIDREMMRLALEIAAETLFGADLSAETETIGMALDTALRAFPALVAPFGEIHDVLPTPTALRARRARRQLHVAVERLIAERRKSGKDAGDFLSLLLAAHDEQGAMSDAQVRDEALTILLAGHETTANAMAWTIDLLGRNPAAARQIEVELDGALAGELPTLSDVAALPLLRGAISEALRLFPPAWLVGRRAVEAVDVGGFRLRRRDIALTSPYVTHRNPRLWPEAERFRPERWLDWAPSQRFAFFPFGGGTRTCIGESFAWLETTLALAAILQRARLTPAAPDAEVALAPAVTLRPRYPIRVRVARRNAPQPIPS